MSTSARPQWFSKQGGHSIRENPTHAVTQTTVGDLRSHLKLKVRQPGQNTEEELRRRDLKAELEKAERDYRMHLKQNKGSSIAESHENNVDIPGNDQNNQQMSVEDVAEQRRRILEEAKKMDGDSDSDSDNSADHSSDASESESDDEEDDTAELLRELERIKAEKAAEKQRQEQQQLQEEQARQEEEILAGNPLLMPSSFALKRRWDDDVVFKNQARGVDEKPQKRFINDMLRSDFHRKFMNKYIK